VVFHAILHSMLQATPNEQAPAKIHIFSPSTATSTAATIGSKSKERLTAIPPDRHRSETTRKVMVRGHIVEKALPGRLNCCVV
jgi:hypothetical protein